MSLFTAQQLTERARLEIRRVDNSYGQDFQKRSKTILAESRNSQSSTNNLKKEFDIFLSHSSDDAEQVLGLKLIIEDLGHSVYIDWIDDPQLDRKKVDKATAKLLKHRMGKSKCLFYAFSENSNQSKWMPWELGYFDALKNKVAILPISQTAKPEFKGTEYLGLYYYIDIAPVSSTGKNALWVRESQDTYIIFNSWLNKENAEPFKR
ncbi:toll/interleukin-1 receptor domain-containing protein [Spirosoma rigui]|uniref:toll/interleukin-1 receptor domain-containing protein n=1 Tax=Spirosoma rigui TaxID=564064 RepID=UPI0009B1799C|nr:TIR domain-containing protein [Spirosoma rigui]